MKKIITFLFLFNIIFIFSCVNRCESLSSSLETYSQLIGTSEDHWCYDSTGTYRGVKKGVSFNEYKEKYDGASAKVDKDCRSTFLTGTVKSGSCP